VPDPDPGGCEAAQARPGVVGYRATKLLIRHAPSVRSSVTRASTVSS
jgi:hypothetical protein